MGFADNDNSGIVATRRSSR